MERTLFIHAGGAKTGTSALQNILERNSDLLLAGDTAYANPVGIRHDLEVTSGNGARLFEGLASSDPDDAEISSILRSYLCCQQKGICSCEAFQGLSSEQWLRLVRVATAAGVRIHVIFFVRDVAPCVTSQYDQLLKRHGEFRELSTYLHTADWDHYGALRSLHACRQYLGLSVLHYDSERHNLLAALLQVVCPGTRIHELFPPLRTVNRSLSEAERAVLRQINLIANDRFCWELSDQFLRDRPDRESSTPNLRRAARAVLQRRFGEQVEWVNREFFGDRRVVKVSAMQGFAVRLRIARASPGWTIGAWEKITRFPPGLPWLWRPARQQPDIALVEAYRQSLEWTVTRLLKNDREQLLSRLIAIESRRPGHATDSLPGGFNSLAYALLHQDVLNSEFDPAEHYLKFGRIEKREIAFTCTPQGGQPSDPRDIMP